jgi:murein DD-endopeptidase MepM/ murein hydrolase activator NlpD
MNFSRCFGCLALLWAFSVGATTRVVNRRIEPGQVMATALREAGLTGLQAEAVISALSGVFDFRKSRAGDQLRLVLVDGELQFLDYRQGATDEWQVHRDGTKLVGARRTFDIEETEALIELAVETSLYEAALSSGEDPSIAMALSDVFAWDVDFYQDVRKGDRVRAVVQKYLSKDRLIRYGDVLAAEYQGATVGTKRVFRFSPERGTPTYFQEDGKSARKTFLKSPLKFANVTSRFGTRFHPVLQYFKAHNGVDYGAAIGTPVWAVGDGTVTRAAQDGVNGKYVCIRHINNFETCYLHLSRFGAGIRTGARVSQKQVVAYSGNTGRSTGPHLHFAMKRGGRFINPLNQHFPRAEPLAKEHLDEFRTQISPWLAQLDASGLAHAEKAGPSAQATP